MMFISFIKYSQNHTWCIMKHLGLDDISSHVLHLAYLAFSYVKHCVHTISHMLLL